MITRGSEEAKGGKPRYVPSDPNCKSTFRPISSLNNWHLSSHVAPRSIKYLVGMSVISCGKVVRMAMRSMEMDAIVGVHARHDGQLAIL